MKKSLIVLLSVMVVLAFAASAFALHAVTTSEYTPGLVKAGKAQVELGGEIRIRGNFSKNTSDFNSDNPDTSQKYDQRVRLRTKANVADKTWALIELETGANNDTTGDGTNTYTWGSAGENRDSKRDALYIRQAYIAHQFGDIGGIKAGHMLLGLGNRLFFDHTNYGDDALLGWITAGPAEISLIDIKLQERTDGNGARQMDDMDAYVLAFEMPIQMVNVSGDVTYIRDNDRTDYNDGTDFVNIGIRADADLKVVKVKGDVEFQTGSSKDSTDPNPEINGDDVKFKGYAAMLGVEGVVGPVTIRGGGAYGSGDDDDDTTADPDKDVNQFVTFLTDNQYSTFIYDYSAKGASGSTNQGLTNTMYLTVGASVKPIPDLKVSADFYYLRAAKEVALNDASDVEGGAVSGCDQDQLDTCDTSKDLGFEIDAKIEYQITSNLVYYVEAGYLFAGDAYQRYDTEKLKNEDADDPYRVRHGLLLTF